MKRFWKLSGFVALLSVVFAVPATAQRTSPKGLALPVTGSFAADGQFAGTISINKFDHEGDNVIAIGFVTGVLKRGNHTIGTVVHGEVEWPVLLTSGGVALAHGKAHTTAKPMRVAWSLGAASMSNLIRVQETCPVLNLALGPHTVNLLGFEVALSPVMLDITGDSSAPLGALVCEVSKLLTNVVGLVGVLNSILGLLTGLLGGIGGIVP